MYANRLDELRTRNNDSSTLLKVPQTDIISTQNTKTSVSNIMIQQSPFSTSTDTDSQKNTARVNLIPAINDCGKLLFF